MSDAWSEATYAGKERGQRRRAVSLTVQQRLEWLEDELRKAEASGVLARVRDRKQRRLLSAWDDGG